MRKESENKSFPVVDRRRLDAYGKRRAPPPPVGGRRVVEYGSIRKPLKLAFSYFRAQLDHLPKSRWPRQGSMASLARGFVVSTQQLNEATVRLMADRFDPTLVLGAGIVVRALVEGVGNFFALLEDPVTAPTIFLRDDYRHVHERLIFYDRRFGKDKPHVTERELKKLQKYASGFGLTDQELADPTKLPKWPLPKRLMERTTPPRLAGERRQVFDELYSFWYSALSVMAHHRLTALQLAVFTEEQPNESTFEVATSSTAALAALSALCVLSEVEPFFELEPCIPLRAAWEVVKDLDDLSQAIYRMRYAKLLGMDLAVR